jgi:oxalate---CoA ligase
MTSTIFNVLQTQVNNQPNACAIFGLENNPCNYLELLNQAQYLTCVLSSMGIGRNDPVAIVLPNGPLMAVAFLSIACTAASAPLNPAFTAFEYDFYLKDLNAKALVIESGSQSPAIEIAQQLDIPIIPLLQNNNVSAGLFAISGNDKLEDNFIPNKSKPSDIALILHTSGTTSRPKMVPLTQKNLCTSAENIRNTLKLTTQDRCLNIMPLFHIHGLMAAVLASITAGGSIICSPGFYAPRFYDWIKRNNPTWYTAVPTMHQVILNRAQENLENIKNSSLRFIRSSSASLPPNIMEDIESTFGVPVIEAYGMTEAAHQMASNPLPPQVRKPGSVGLPAGPEIAIMDEDQSTLLPQGEIGEVVIRGDNVTLGYINNKQANQQSFTDGWFRTGDQGYLDSDGYLYLTGRLKEIINRGGEKISPREVDEVLLKHPGVEQVVTFGIPDETLGENVAAAVVLTNPSITDQELIQFAAAHLANHKIPNQIIILDEIPKGPTGKLQRIGLAEQLGFGKLSMRKNDKKTIFKAPQTKNEKLICNIWQKILDIPKIGINDDFRQIGGDSMLATLIHVEIEAIFGITISLIKLFAARTVYEQSKFIEAELSRSQENVQ